MSFDYYSRRNHAKREIEILGRISTLLSALSPESSTPTQDKFLTPLPALRKSDFGLANEKNLIKSGGFANSIVPTEPEENLSKNNKAQSHTPKLTLFHFSPPKISKRVPTLSFSKLSSEEKTKPRNISQFGNIEKKVYALKKRKPFVATFIRPKISMRKHQIGEDSLGRYKRILNLTQELIDRDNLKGWN